MSVIFKALTRLGRQSAAGVERPVEGHLSRLLPRRRWYAAVLLLTMACGLGAVLIHQVALWSGGQMAMEATATAAVSAPAALAGDEDMGPEVVFQPAKAMMPAGRQVVSSNRKQAVDADKRITPEKSTRSISVAKVIPTTHSLSVRAAGAEVASQSASGKKERSRSQWMARLARQRKQTATLVADIRNAMARKNFDLAELLLERLSVLKGNDNLLVLQLRAYWMIQKGRWQEAEDMLNRILEAQPDDREAALNLAVVQIKTGRLRQARQRLKELYLRFPEDDRIGQWLDLLDQ